MLADCLARIGSAHGDGTTRAHAVDHDGGRRCVSCMNARTTKKRREKKRKASHQPVMWKHPVKSQCHALTNSGIKPIKFAAESFK